MKIKDFDYENLGNVVCGALDEHFDINCNFDYIVCSNDDVVFRFLFDDFFEDYLLSDLRKKYKTINNLIVHLVVLEKEKALEKVV